LGGFRSVPRADFKPVSFKPVVLGTRSHHLAMYVVYENPMPMVCDAPTAYLGQPGFDFIRDVPSAWDETRVLTGEVGHYIVLARRKGRDWYLGAMTDWTARRLQVPLNFLGSGHYQVDGWSDDPVSDDPNAVVARHQSVMPADTLTFQLRSGGGQALAFHPE